VQTLASRDYTQSQRHAWAAAIRDVEEFARRCAATMTWVALCEAQLAGFSVLEPDGHIDMLYVHPRFARRGVARALLTQIESIATTRGIPRLYTEASLTARPVFERSGFELIAAQTVTVDGEEMPNYRMEKRLSV
jgi:putative acetyltransferase